MAQPKFSAGERVSITRAVGFSAISSACRVVAPLPRDAGPQQYRVRSEAESFDRIIDEARLESVMHA
ncbi:MAG: hypothetical protein IPL62_02410 [Caulobacteraceae bacterium]|jgi:hypothetical protein|nr:hypothetical protein [Caulobacteraceae bacterium]MBK8542507.1 hypothetical protein [Caulobacteraceae bacterium]MBP6690001.1 hypothetical protein [Hyphomonadaceae bacterium]